MLSVTQSSVIWGFGYSVSLWNKVCFVYYTLFYFIHTIWLVVCQLCVWWSPLMENFKLYETGSRLPHCFLFVSLYNLSQWRDSPSSTHFSWNTSFSENACSFSLSLSPSLSLSSSLLYFRRPWCLTTSESNGASEKMTSSITGWSRHEATFSLFLCKSMKTEWTCSAMFPFITLP